MFFIEEYARVNILFSQIWTNPGPRLMLPAKRHSQSTARGERILPSAGKSYEIRAVCHAKFLGMVV